jgi:hypothetical protein
MADPKIPEAQVVDQVAALDRELNASLTEFDDMLLKEMDAIRKGSETKLLELAEDAAEVARRLREKGVGKGRSMNEEDRKEGRKTGTEIESGDSPPRTDTVSKNTPRKSGEGSSSKNQRRTDYDDDDIVARQLREAAENETDPELKEKLWREYEEYKKNRQ